MDSLTLLLLAFVFVCLIWPGIIRRRASFFAGVGGLMLAMALRLLIVPGFVRPSSDMGTLLVFANELLQWFAALSLILAASGLSLIELVREVVGAAGTTIEPRGFPVEAPRTANPPSHDK